MATGAARPAAMSVVLGVATALAILALLVPWTGAGGRETRYRWDRLEQPTADGWEATYLFSTAAKSTLPSTDLLLLRMAGACAALGAAIGLLGLAGAPTWKGSRAWTAALVTGGALLVAAMPIWLQADGTSFGAGVWLTTLAGIAMVAAARLGAPPARRAPG